MRSHVITVHLFLGLLGLTASAIVTAGPAAAQAMIEVDTLDDPALVDPATSLLHCVTDPGNHTCSLREAIHVANTNNNIGVVDVITVLPGIAAGGTIDLLLPYVTGDLEDGDLDILDAVTIIGNGVTVSAAGIRSITGGALNADRVFDVVMPAGAPGDVLVTLQDMTVRDGYTQGTQNGALDFSGGGIRALSPQGPPTLRLVLDDLDLLGNADNPVEQGLPGSTFGGALFTLDTAVEIRNSTLSGNFAAFGGGLSVFGGTLTIDGSTVTDNHSADDLGAPAGPSLGGGVDIFQATGAITASLVADNGGGRTLPAPQGAAVPTVGGAPTGIGGGIAIFDVPNAPGFTIADSTVVRNTARLAAGGVDVVLALATIEGSTISSNVLLDDLSPGPLEERGAGGVLNWRSTLKISNSTITGNRANRGAAIHQIVSNADPVAPDVASSTLQHVTIADNGPVGPPAPDTASIEVAGEGDPAEDQNVFTSFNSILQTADGAGGLPMCRLATTGSVTGFLSSDGSSADDATCGLNKPGDVTGVTQLLDALGDHGGPFAGDAPTAAVVQTRPLQAGQEGVDAAVPTGSVAVGAPPTCPADDQRNQPRPLDGDGNGAATCDRGAFELAAQPPPPPPAPAVVPTPDLSLTKTGPADAAVGDSITFTLTASVTAASAPSTVITDSVPAGFTVTSASAPCTVSGNNVSCAVGTVSPGSPATVTVVVTVDADGTLFNQACVQTPAVERDPSNNCGTATVEATQVATTRVEGPERIGTSIAGSQQSFEAGAADAVVLTRQDDHPDAQTGTPLAVDRNGPLLLSQTSVLTPETEDEILRVLPVGATVYLLGGAEALSPAVEARIVELGYVAVRLGGANRYATGVEIAEELGSPSTLLIADGGTFSEALVAGAAGTQVSGAVLLTRSTSVPDETRAYLDTRADASVVAIGAVAPGQFPDAEAIAGDEPAALSVAVAERFFTSPTAVGVATALSFADGLVGGTVVNSAAIGAGPILLTDPDALPDVLADYLRANAADLERLFVFGGPSAITPAVEEEINAALGL